MIMLAGVSCYICFVGLVSMRNGGIRSVSVWN